MKTLADPLAARESDIHLLASFIHDSESAEKVPIVFIRIMKEGAWLHFKNVLNREVKPRDFKEFVETPYPSGVGSNLEILRKLIEGNNEAIDFYDSVTQRKPGENQYTMGVDNVNDHRPDGNTKTYALRTGSRIAW